jgi:hypothetical protein
VPADASSLAVVGHEDHRGLIELSLLVEPSQELGHPPVGLGDLVEVLGAAHPAYVSELVRGEELENQQVGILGRDDLARGGGERVVDLRGRLDRGDGAHALAERVEEVRDAHEAAAPAVALEHVEDRLAAHAEPRREVGAHPVLGGRGAGEHRGEAHDRPRRVGRLDRQVLGALASQAVHRRRVCLPEAAAVEPVYDDDVDTPGERRALSCSLSRRRVPGKPPAREPPPREPAQERSDGRCRGDAQDALRSRLLREQGRHAERHQELRRLLKRVAARRIGVREHEPPEAQEVRPRRAGAKPVVEGAPEEDREGRVAREGAHKQPRCTPRLEQ